MKKAHHPRITIFVWFFACMLALVGCREQVEVDSARSGAERLDRIAGLYAPIILQETDPDCFRCDLITKFNFDGNYRGDDNWDNLEKYESVPAHVYYSVTETASHYFIGYYFFHPRDWGIEHGPVDVPLSNHENDLEGIMLLVEKAITGEPGALLAMETQGHNQFQQFSRCPGSGETDAIEAVASGQENLDGCVLTYAGGESPSCDRDDGGCLPEVLTADLFEANGYHPVVEIESNGHGVSACTNTGIAYPLNVSCRQPSTGTGVIYLPGNQADTPSTETDGYKSTAQYALIAMEAGTHAPGSPDEDQGFWYLRNLIGEDQAFASWGRLRGDRDTGLDVSCGEGVAVCQQNAALAPWTWDDPNDGPVHVGDWFCDPAYSFSAHLDGPFEERYGYRYIEPYYYTHAIRIEGIRNNTGECDSGGEDCDVFISVRATGTRGSGIVVGRDNWLFDNMPTGEWIEWNHGAGSSASAVEDLVDPRNSRWICRQGGMRSTFRVDVLDADAASRDDRIGRRLELRGPYSEPVIGGEDVGGAEVRFRIDVKDARPVAQTWLEEIIESIRGLWPFD